MILESRFSPRVSVGSLAVALWFGLVVLPAALPISGSPAQAGPQMRAAAPAQAAETQGKSEFPYAVKFEQGATRFLDGDKITILEVRGTAEKFVPGNLYWIKGTHTFRAAPQGWLVGLYHGETCGRWHRGHLSRFSPRGFQQGHRHVYPISANDVRGLATRQLLPRRQRQRFWR